MPGQIGKCSSCGKPKETLVIECSSCQQWLPYGCAGCLLVMMSLSLNLYPFTVASACQETGNSLVALKTQPNVTIVVAKQAQGRKRQFNVHSVIGPFTSLV